MRCDAMHWREMGASPSGQLGERSGQCSGEWTPGAATQGKTANWRMQKAGPHWRVGPGIWQHRAATPDLKWASLHGSALGMPMHNLKISLLFWSNGRLFTLSPNMSPTRQSTTGGQPLYDLAISPFTIPQSLQLSLSLSGQTLHGPAPITGDDGSETNH